MSIAVLFSILCFATVAFAGGNPKFAMQPGDQIYACACGEACPCDTLSQNAGACTCGVDLVEASVVSVDGDTAVISIDGEEETVKRVGKYVCACGEACPCDFISQNPGSCTCGVELKEAS
jgi:hypothetical protein